MRLQRSDGKIAGFHFAIYQRQSTKLELANGSQSIQQRQPHIEQQLDVDNEPQQ